MDSPVSPRRQTAQSPRPTLLAAPNVSEGADLATIAAIARAFTVGMTTPGDVNGASVRLLDRHSDADHGRTVYTLAGASGLLAEALLKGATETVARIDVMSAAATVATAAAGSRGAATKPRDAAAKPRGQHPRVGALDVAPIVYLDERTRGDACAEALVLADRIGHELSVPVFLYGELGDGRARAELRRGGVAGLARRIAAGELRPDFGPARLHPRAGATLVAARALLVAFNLRLMSPATVDDASRIAALIREGGDEGLPGLRALGIALSGGVAQVSMNVERPSELPLAKVVEAVSRHADIDAAELVGLAPRVALTGFPEDVPLSGFDPARHVIENALGL